jgi:hypothetical protein
MNEEFLVHELYQIRGQQDDKQYSVSLTFLSSGWDAFDMINSTINAFDGGRNEQ